MSEQGVADARNDSADALAGEPLEKDVLRVRDISLSSITGLFEAAGLVPYMVDSGQDIPGSHWGDDEAGLIGSTLYIREDTPVHSAIHEGCHYLLMSEERRAKLHTDAGGTSTEENAVCYLQILLADSIPAMGRARMLQDMDAWGYSFRLGSAQAWFDNDADDAIDFLRQGGYLP